VIVYKIYGFLGLPLRLTRSAEAILTRRMILREALMRCFANLLSVTVLAGVLLAACETRALVSWDDGRHLIARKTLSYQCSWGVVTLLVDGSADERERI
jgi:hypothetical protein